MSFLREAAHLRIPFESIKVATKNFTTVIGKGGFGVVYKGELLISGKHTTVAVKRLDHSNISGQGYKEFLTEVRLLFDYKHPNLVRLLGFCEMMREKILVYEYAENGSLEKYLSPIKTSLIPVFTWKQRIKICLGVARGLDHLHNFGQKGRRVVHRDIKSSNILLDQNWKPMISDFGISKIGGSDYRDDSYLVTYNGGTYGYCDPVYLDTGFLAKESDIYSLGVVLFEVLCGRLCFLDVNSEERFLTSLVERYFKEGKLNEIIDPELKDVFDSDSVSKFSEIAYLCIHKDRAKRPPIKLVVQRLREAFELLEEPWDEALELHSSRLTNIWSCRRFSLHQIEIATDEFYQSLLGNGAFGTVYSGNIFGRQVAVKRMRMDPELGIPAFEKEIKLLSACHHVNIISLIGYCDEDAEKILVYEFMPNGSLYDYLFNKERNTPCLTIENRLDICLGVARGLCYLHSRHDINIIHSDIKADNILLDGNLVPKISDFGLSRTRIAGASSSQQVTNHIQGTEGYLAPECYEPNYKLSRKVDVYAFGIVLLEVLCERPAWKRVVTWALPLATKGELQSFVPEYVKTNISSECLRACEDLIKDCLENDASKRPNMSAAVKRLKYALKLQNQKQTA